MRPIGPAATCRAPHASRRPTAERRDIVVTTCNRRRGPRMCGPRQLAHANATPLAKHLAPPITRARLGRGARQARAPGQAEQAARARPAWHTPTDPLGHWSPRAANPDGLASLDRPRSCPATCWPGPLFVTVWSAPTLTVGNQVDLRPSQSARPRFDSTKLALGSRFNQIQLIHQNQSDRHTVAWARVQVAQSDNLAPTTPRAARPMGADGPLGLSRPARC